MQEDTFRGDGLNLYTYVANNPIKYIDPTGHCKEDVSFSDAVGDVLEKVHMRISGFISGLNWVSDYSRNIGVAGETKVDETIYYFYGGDVKHQRKAAEIDKKLLEREYGVEVKLIPVVSQDDFEKSLERNG